MQDTVQRARNFEPSPQNFGALLFKSLKKIKKRANY